MVVELSTDLIFLAVIVLYAFRGMKRGCSVSFGSLISVILSWLIARFFALPIATYIFANFGLDAKISGIMDVFRFGMNDAIASMDTLNGFGNLGLFGLSKHLTTMAAGVVNQSALNITSMFVSMILFSVNMFVFRLILRKVEDSVKDIPMGSTMNGLIGLIFGAIKGIFIAMLIYFAIYLINLLFHTNIPLDQTYIGHLFNLISKIHL